MPLRFLPNLSDDFAQKNILIDSNFRPRLTNYGLVAIMLDPNIHDPGGTTCSPTDTVRYMAPELLNPAGFGLDTSNPTKKSDVYAFGIVTYQVGITHYASVTVIDVRTQVITGQLPYPGAKDGVIIYNAVSGERPARPSGPNEWLSDDVWNFVSRCLSASWDGRPDVDFAINTLNDAADAVEVGWGKAQVINDQGKGAAHHDSGASYKKTDHGHGLTVVTSERIHSKQRIDPVTIRRKKACKLQGRREREKEYT